jgi:hypothetical protein
MIWLLRIGKRTPALRATLPVAGQNDKKNFAIGGAL